MVPRTRTDAVAVRLPRRRFTVDEYHRMGEAGVLAEDDRVGRGRLVSPLAFPRVRFRTSEILG
jgi:hypothetical protein